MNFLLQTSLALVLLYAAYHFLLRREGFFRFNRWFILGALGLSAGLPWLRLPVVEALTAIPMLTLPEATVLATNAEASGWSFSWNGVWLAVYWAGVGLMVVRLLLQLFRLAQWRQRLPTELHNGYELIYTGGQLPTFSFFHWLFWDETAPLTGTQQTLVLAHEQAHVRQMHSADVLLLEIAKCFLWFHPAVYAFGREQRTVHEYLADQAAMQEGSAESYTALLVQTRLQTLSLLLAQPFQQSSLRNRIEMIRNARNVRPAAWKAAAGLLVAILVAVVFACSDRAMLTPGRLDVSGRVLDDAGQPLPGAHVIVKGTNTGTTANADGRYTLANIPANSTLVVSFVGFSVKEFPVKRMRNDVTLVPGNDPVGTPPPPPPPPIFSDLSEEPFVAVEEMPAFEGGIEGLTRYLNDNIRYPENARKNGQYGTVFVTFVVKTDGGITDVQVAKGVSPELDAEAMRVITQMPNWKPGRQSGKNVPVRYAMPVKFTLPD